MTSREAFEAALTRAIEEQKDPRFYSTIDAINWAWQAAIQHARDVGEDCIEHELGETGQAKAIVHAIKEALK